MLSDRVHLEGLPEGDQVRRRAPVLVQAGGGSSLKRVCCRVQTRGGGPKKSDGMHSHCYRWVHFP